MFLHQRELLQAGENPKALDLLAEPHSFQGLPEVSQTDAILQVYIIPSFAPLASWTVYHTRNAPDCLVRRVIWKRRRSVVLSAASSSTYGADAILKWSEVDDMLRDLGQMSFPAFAANSTFGTDGTTYGIRRMSFMSQCEATWWNEAPHGWEKLTVWHASLIKLLDFHLPQRTP